MADAVFGQFDRLPVLAVAAFGVGVIGLSLLADAGEVVTGRAVGLGRTAVRSVVVGVALLAGAAFAVAADSRQWPAAAAGGGVGAAFLATGVLAFGGNRQYRAWRLWHRAGEGSP